VSIAGYIDGHPMCSHQIAHYKAFVALCRAHGKPVPLVMQGIGGATASAGTHLNGCVTDYQYVSDWHIWALRQMGADATWRRRYNWDGKGGAEHVHSVLTSGPDNANARYQITAVRDGYNGLGYLGRAARDDGPRPLSGRSYTQGIQWAAAQGEDTDMTMTPEQDALLKAVAQGISQLKEETGVEVGSGGVVRGTRLYQQVDNLSAKVDAISVGGVDIDALAAKVADLLAARLAQ
jgi:hypothetical protein